MNDNGDNRLSPEAFLARLKEGERARLRVYIGAAPGVGKTFQMLEEAHLLEKQVVDVVIAVVETYKRADTEAMVGDLERVPPRIPRFRFLAPPQGGGTAANRVPRGAWPVRAGWGRLETGHSPSTPRPG